MIAGLSTLAAWFASGGFVHASVLGAMDNVANWAEHNGYPAIALIVALDGVIPIFPGETVVVAGGHLAGQGSLWIVGVVIAGMIGAMIGDSTAYWLGRAGGERIDRWLMRVAGRDRLEAAQHMVQRRGPVLVTAGRFLPGIRIAINFTCGAGHMTYRKFLTFNALGALIWSVQATILGYIFGKRFEDRPWIGLTIAVSIAVLIGGLVALYEHRKVKRERAYARERDVILDHDADADGSETETSDTTSA